MLAGPLQTSLRLALLLGLALSGGATARAEHPAAEDQRDLPPATLYLLERIAREYREDLRSLRIHRDGGALREISLEIATDRAHGREGLLGGAFHAASDGYYLIRGVPRHIERSLLVRVERRDLPGYLAALAKETASLEASCTDARRALRGLPPGETRDQQEFMLSRCEDELRVLKGDLVDARATARGAQPGPLARLLQGYKAPRGELDGTEVRVAFDGAVYRYLLPTWPSLAPVALRRLFRP